MKNQQWSPVRITHVHTLTHAHTVHIHTRVHTLTCTAMYASKQTTSDENSQSESKFSLNAARDNM